MQFNDLLALAGLDPRRVAIMMHTPATRDQRSALMALVEDAPAVFEAYQDNHPRIAEASLKARGVAASFVVGEEGEGRFVGLHDVAGWRFLTAAEMDAEPIRQDLIRRFRGVSYSASARLRARSGCAVFDLRPRAELKDLRGRLVVARAPGHAYMRLAENSTVPVLEVARQSRFVPPPPDWDAFIITGAELRVLPRSWASRLREWRGVYLITDQTDGARYVGAAYGETNLLGRWSAHVSGDCGLTVDLAGRNPETFRFSILEVVSPAAPVDSVLAVETGWKARLDTRAWGLNRN